MRNNTFLHLGQAATEDNICLAVSAHAKKRGIQNRCRIKDIPIGMNVIIAKPRMQLYIDCSAAIYGVFLKYLAPEDIYVYSIDEAFLDVTPYKKLYQMSTKELAQKIMQDVKDTVGTICTCGIGTNLYLAKIALDLTAKHAADFIGELDEASYREKLWDHKPITDFWRISHGTAARLKKYGITTMRGIASVNEDCLYREFGIDAELLIDHAWGREPTTIQDIKNYQSKSKSLSSGQVLMRDYQAHEGELIAKEMTDQLSLDLTEKNYVTESITLWVGYSKREENPGVLGTAHFCRPTNLATEMVPAIAVLYRRIVDSRFMIRRINLTCNRVTKDTGVLQLNMFEDVDQQLRQKALQETLLGIRARYGKNSILKGMNFEEAATGRERNEQIGGHRRG